MMCRYLLLNVSEDTVNRLAAFFYVQKNKLPHVILLDGEVGAGKTAFSRMYMTAGQLDVSFASPTYTIVREYKLPDARVEHFDLYRIGQSDYDWIYERLENGSAFFLFEWAELHPLLFEDVDTIAIAFFYDSLTTRNLKISISEKYSKVLEEFLKDEGIVFEKRDESDRDAVR